MSSTFLLASVLLLGPQGQQDYQLGRPGLAHRFHRELAGRPLPRFPHFHFVTSFNDGEPVSIAFDTLNDVRLANRTVDVYVIEHAEFGEFLSGRPLDSVTGTPLTASLTPNGVQENTFVLNNTGTIPGSTGSTVLGHAYDVVVDVDRNGLLGPVDIVDGGPNKAGFYVVEDFVTFNEVGTKETGPYEVVETLIDWGPSFTGEDIYYPENIASLGALPLIIISHGNGHNYQWYDHMGYHMASWGYVVMSHENNTGPGIQTASTSTLQNTNLFIDRHDEIDGGVLVGHVDVDTIVWLGHSRGGEGVARAYRRLLEGDPLATLYGPSDIKLVSSIAPVDFLGVGESDVGPLRYYHLWTGGSDADVNGCADCDICQTFHLLDRADETRFSTSLHGAGHGDFHDGGGSSVASGPCLIGRLRTHQVMRGYFLPLVQFVLDGNPACLDYLTRQYEEFRPLGAPAFSEPCVVVDLMYSPGPLDAPRVIDDFQAQPSLAISSSGGAVVASAGLSPSLAEGRLDDANGTFTASVTDVMNGMTAAGPGDNTAGLVLEWSAADEFLMFEVPAGLRNLAGYSHLSFRAAQSTRDALTVAELGDVDFSVELTDSALNSSTIEIGAYAGGIEEPYQRGNCGTGLGWANEFETIRIPLKDFRRDGTPLILSDVAAITFLFGPSHGSTGGRIGLDEIVFTQE